MSCGNVKALRAAEPRRTNSVQHLDSAEKIMSKLAALSPNPVSYIGINPNGKLRNEQLYDGAVEVVIGPSMFRKFTCVPFCTACCQKLTLDFVPLEWDTIVTRKNGFKPRTIIVNGERKQIWTNDQTQNPLCDFLASEKPGGGLGCSHWPAPPLSCLSAPQVSITASVTGKTQVQKRPFGRAWAIKPLPMCEFDDTDSIEEMDLTGIVATFDRFQMWADYFEIQTCIGGIQDALREVEASGVVPKTSIHVWSK